MNSPPALGERHLLSLGINPGASRAQSTREQFPDGGTWRLEIPSVEGPAVLAEVLDEAQQRDVPIHRVSQGSGVMMLTDDEIVEMLELATSSGVEVCLFLGPRGTWDVGVAVRSVSGGSGPRSRGREQLGQCLEDAHRAAELGVRCLLVADEGVLWAIHQQRLSGDLPADIRLKSSVLTAPVNPMSVQVMAGLGADSINVPSDLSIGQISDMRASTNAAMDLYLEAPDDVGGTVRLYDAAELVHTAGPLYLKFGLRNAPGIYPVGGHLQSVAAQMGRERVRRAHLVLGLLARVPDTLNRMSPLGSHALPEPPRFSMSHTAGA